MAALTQEKARRTEPWKYHEFTLSSGTKAYKGGRAVFNLGVGEVVPATSSTGRLAIGVFAETIDATSAAKTVTVDLEKEIVVEWFANATGGDAVLAADIGRLAYHLDDATVTITATGRSVAGRVWAVHASKGVAIEKIDVGSPQGAVSSLPTAGSFTSNDYAPTTIEHGAIYAVPTTGAASTITLPAAASDGSVAYFLADGSANGHTVQYRDATGPTNLTTALTASRRHLVVVAKRAGAWAANAYVAP